MSLFTDMFGDEPTEVVHDNEQDYDVRDTDEYQEGHFDGVEAEREKWLPLWLAVKELESYSDIDMLRSADVDSYQRHGFNVAKQNLRQVMITLRSSGEK